MSHKEMPQIQPKEFGKLVAKHLPEFASIALFISVNTSSLNANWYILDNT